LIEGEIKMQVIFYPGSINQICRAQYGIAIRDDESITSVNIVVINSPRAAPLWTSRVGRDLVLNRILTNELLGIRMESVRFFVLADTEAPGRMTGIELSIKLDLNDYMKNGNPYQIRRVAVPSLLGRLRHLVGMGQKTISFWSGHVLGGCAYFYVDFEQCRHLPPEEIGALCAAVGYQRGRDELPTWLANCFTAHP